MRSFRSSVALMALTFAPALCSQAPQAFTLSGDYSMTHDPSIALAGSSYYVFSTTTKATPGQLPIRCSADLQAWKLCGSVFDKIPDWIQAASPKTRELWAPDISYYKGKYRLYYVYSTFGSNSSGIALATNDTLDVHSPKYHWQDEGLVLKSTAGTDDFNAIDPNLVTDEEGRQWLSFGSFWTGIKMRRIDPATGKVSSEDATIYSLASRARPATPELPKPGLPADWQAVEAPFIVHHGDYFYLFVSFDLCCRGAKSTYRTMVGRSRQVTGPYIDSDGKPMLEGGGTQLLEPNSRWLGPGGASILQRPEGDLIVFHAYDAATGKPALQISTLTWESGWPRAAVGTAGESR